MDFEIVNRQILSPDIRRLEIRAPMIAAKVKAGQFVRICAEEGDNPVSLTVVDMDAGRGVITLIVHESSPSARKLGEMPINEMVYSILGPLGEASFVEKFGTIVCVATGPGIAQILPVARALKKTGNKLIGIIGARTKKELLLEAQMRLACHKIFVTTDDGSYERRGLATDLFRKLLIDLFPTKQVNKEEKIDRVYASGSVDMMETVCGLTRESGIATRVMIYPVMVDCAGMCGSCRIRVGGKTVLGCVDGPEFNGHDVDFQDLKIRMNAWEQV